MCDGLRTIDDGDSADTVRLLNDALDIILQTEDI